jgi:chromosome segregation and condensation protein ScpB
MLKSDESLRHELLEHLAHVRDLSRAIESAISAIEHNDLQTFANHLATQETICNRLSDLKSTLSSSGLRLDESASQGSHLQQQLVEAYSTLAQLNRAYSALLRRAGKSLALVSALYRSHGEGYSSRPSLPPQRHSWSCEV